MYAEFDAGRWRPGSRLARPLTHLVTQAVEQLESEASNDFGGVRREGGFERFQLHGRLATVPRGGDGVQPHALRRHH